RRAFRRAALRLCLPVDRGSELASAVLPAPRTLARPPGPGWSRRTCRGSPLGRPCHRTRPRDCTRASVLGAWHARPRRRRSLGDARAADACRACLRRDALASGRTHRLPCRSEPHHAGLSRPAPGRRAQAADWRGADRRALGRFHRRDRPCGANRGLAARSVRMTQILRLSLPITFWLIGFSALYALQGLSCSRHWPAGLDPRTGLLVGAALYILVQGLALLAILRNPS